MSFCVNFMCVLCLYCVVFVCFMFVAVFDCDLGVCEYVDVRFEWMYHFHIITPPHTHQLIQF